MYKKNFYLLIFLIIFPLNNSLAKSAFVYLDMDLILNNSKVGQNIIEQLNKENNIIQKNFIDNEKKLKEEESQLISKKKLLSNNEYNKAIDIFSKKVLTYNQNKKKSLNSLAKKKIKSQEQIINILNPILLDYIEKESITIVFKKESIIVAPTELNITEEIIQRLNGKISKLKIK